MWVLICGPSNYYVCECVSDLCVKCVKARYVVCLGGVGIGVISCGRMSACISHHNTHCV